MEKLLDKIKKFNLTKKNVFVKDSKIKDDELLISYIYYCQLRPKKCEKCKINPEWNNKFLPFLVYRKNKKINDNTLENIKILCPNCYYQKCPNKNNYFIDENKKDKKFINCIDCNRKFKKKVYNISLNPSDDNSKKHRYVKKRCNFCLDNNIVKSNLLDNSVKSNLLDNSVKSNLLDSKKERKINCEDIIVI